MLVANGFMKNIGLGVKVMSEELKQKLEKWQKAKLAVADNAKIMCSNPSEANVQFCADGMKRLYSAKEELFDFCKTAKELPQEISDWLVTLNDKGCNHCWLVSTPIKQHPECQDKIIAYHAAEEKLMEIAL